MGEAKIKEQRRREQANKIVDAFEKWIDAKINAEQDTKSLYQYDVLQGDIRATREGLIDALVEPPPK